jgi:ADP-dependent NAD(P)H-hydrate dehydratase / NAD(P)H-hydrate epimerase
MTDPGPAGTALFDVDGVRAIEARAIGRVDGGADALMARAGLAAWRCVLAHWAGAGRIAVACGPGNNGGDGYVLARHARAAGRDVRVVRLDAHAPRTEAARAACAAYSAAGGRVEPFDGAFGDCDLVVDAVFGIGFAREPDPPTATLLEAIDRAAADVLSLDVPSGLDARRGAAPGAAVHATRTLQFLVDHAAIRTGTALEHVGVLERATLDVPQDVFEGLTATAELLRPGALRHWLAPRRRNAHKGDAGHVLCIGGDHGRGGAAILAADAALHAGAGLVSVATRRAHVAAVLARRPEVMAHGVDDAAVPPALLHGATVVAAGPGLGRDAWGRTLFASALAAAGALVLDADALNLLADTPSRLPADCILTPHPGEAGRLLGSSSDGVQADRFGAVRALCARFGCVVVLKGAGTLVAAPDVPVRVVCAGNPGMAVGGMGDMLTGTIAALRAQGLAAFDAAAAGALLHAVAGDDAAGGDTRGLLPSDLLPALRRHANP